MPTAESAQITDEARVIPMEGVHNFRDYGGYALSGGGRLRQGVLWRSGQHFGATDADLDKIAALGLTAVFDLRTSKERDLFPCRRPDGFAGAAHYSADPDRPKFAPHLEAARKAPGNRSAADITALMCDTYTRIAFRPELLAMTRGLADTLIESDGPTLVNCMAGKDRTGIAVAAIHMAAGVHPDDVMADFMLTNTAGDSEARIQTGMATVREVNEGISDEAARAIMGVEEVYLDTALAAIAERHGSVDGWLADTLGLDAARREQLREAIGES